MMNRNELDCVLEPFPPCFSSIFGQELRALSIRVVVTCNLEKELANVFFFYSDSLRFINQHFRIFFVLGSIRFVFAHTYCRAKKICPTEVYTLK